MGTTLSDIHQKILDDYFDQGLSYSILSSKFGRSEQALRRLVKAAEASGRTRTKQPIDRRNIVATTALTHIHKRIGMRFIRWRSVENNYSTPEAAAILGLTLNRLSAIENGIHNWTLLELVNTCERLNWNFLDLLRGADLKDFMVPDAA